MMPITAFIMRNILYWQTGGLGTLKLSLLFKYLYGIINNMRAYTTYKNLIQINIITFVRVFKVIFLVSKNNDFLSYCNAISLQ